MTARVLPASAIRGTVSHCLTFFFELNNLALFIISEATKCCFQFLSNEFALSCDDFVLLFSSQLVKKWNIIFNCVIGYTHSDSQRHSTLGSRGKTTISMTAIV